MMIKVRVVSSSSRFSLVGASNRAFLLVVDARTCVDDAELSEKFAYDAIPPQWAAELCVT
jgi:hypothetical protein